MEQIKVIKYCKEEHATSALKMGNIRIGTVQGYQRIENQKIKDPSEGITPYIISSGNEPFVLTNEESNNVFQSHELKLINDWKIALPANIDTKIITSSFNTFIYSASSVDSPEKTVMEKLGYDSFYKIKDVDQFALRVADSIKSTLNLQQEVLFARANCVYVETKGRLITPETRDLITPFDRSVKINDLFTKEKSLFEEEKEHRIIWLIHNGNGNYGSIKGLEHLDLACPEICDLLE